MENPVKPEERKTCPTCNAQGEVADDSGRFKFKVCPECRGQGWVKK